MQYKFHQRIWYLALYLALNILYSISINFEFLNTNLIIVIDLWLNLKTYRFSLIAFGFLNWICIGSLFSAWLLPLCVFLRSNSSWITFDSSFVNWNDIVLFLCQKNGKWIAGALNFIGRDTLFGRYWGCIENYPCLHFEVCYYLAIEFAIKNNLSRVEAGAQGEHKLARGYLPVPTYSLHWFENKGFSNAVEEYLIAERKAVGDDIEVLTDYGPFRKTLED